MTKLMDKWEDGWTTLFKSLDSLTDEDLFKTVVIRGESFSAHEALLRLMAHASYHVGQMVYHGQDVPLGRLEVPEHPSRNV